MVTIHDATRQQQDEQDGKSCPGGLTRSGGRVRGVSLVSPLSDFVSSLSGSEVGRQDCDCDVLEVDGLDGDR